MLVLQRGHSGDGCDLASTLCKYELMKGDLLCAGQGCGEPILTRRKSTRFIYGSQRGKEIIESIMVRS